MGGHLIVRGGEPDLVETSSSRVDLGRNVHIGSGKHAELMLDVVCMAPRYRPPGHTITKRASTLGICDGVVAADPESVCSCVVNSLQYRPLVCLHLARTVARDTGRLAEL